MMAETTAIADVLEKSATGIAFVCVRNRQISGKTNNRSFAGRQR